VLVKKFEICVITGSTGPSVIRLSQLAAAMQVV